MEEAIGYLIGFVILAAIVIYIIAIIAGIFVTICLIATALGTFALSIIMIKNYGVAFYDCLTGKLPASFDDKPTPPEPAYKNYFFRKAYFDLYDIIAKAYDVNRDEVRKVFAMLENYKSGWGWVLVIFGYGGIGVCIAGTSVLFAIVAFIHASCVAAICLCVYIVAIYLRLTEIISQKYRSITYECPRCYKKIGLLVHICGKCSSPHHSLMPGSYGVFRRKCQCGSSLPTIDLLGRSALDRECPHSDCKFPFKGEAARTVHIPIIGGPSTGKSNYLVAMVSEFIKDATALGKRISYPYHEDEQQYNRALSGFRSGIPVDKTQERAPKSFNIMVEEGEDYRHNLYIYDAAGELYGGEEDQLRKAGFLKLAHGVIFIVDPFSLPEVKIDAPGEALKYISPSLENPQSVLERLLDYIDHNGKELNWRKVPIAVVISKSDALEGSGIPLDIKGWLTEKGLGSFVNTIDNHFDSVDYYCSSALGHSIDEKKSFAPVNVLAPLKVLLEKKKLEIMTKGKDISRLKSQKVATFIGFSTATIIYASCFIPLFMVAKPAFNYVKKQTSTLISVSDNRSGKGGMKKRDVLPNKDGAIEKTSSPSGSISEGGFTEKNRHRAQENPLTAIDYNYSAIREKKFEEAYKLRSNRVRQSTSYKKFYENWSSNVSISLTNKKLLSNNGNTAVINVDLLSTDINKPDSQQLTLCYGGKVIMIKANNMWYYDDAKISEIKAKISNAESKSQFIPKQKNHIEEQVQQDQQKDEAYRRRWEEQAKQDKQKDEAYRRRWEEQAKQDQQKEEAYKRRWEEQAKQDQQKDEELKRRWEEQAKQDQQKDEESKRRWEEQNK